MKQILLSCAFALAAFPALAEIVVEPGEARISRPGAPSGAAFLTVTNTGDLADRLTGARTDAAEKAQLHTHVHEDGVMKMLHVQDGFEIAAGESLALERGGDHVMLMGLAPLDPEGTLNLTLIFENAGEIEVELPVALPR